MDGSQTARDNEQQKVRNESKNIPDKIGKEIYQSSDQSIFDLAKLGKFPQSTPHLEVNQTFEVKPSANVINIFTNTPKDYINDNGFGADPIKPIFRTITDQAFKKAQQQELSLQTKNRSTSHIQSKKTISYVEGIKAISNKIKQIKDIQKRSSQPELVKSKNFNQLRKSDESKIQKVRPNTGKHSKVNSIKLTEDEIKFLSDTLQREIREKRSKSSRR